MKKLFFSSLFSLATAALWAQNTPHSHNGQPCLYDHAIEQSGNKNYYQQAIEQTFRQAQQLGAQYRGVPATLTIPVVVHVVAQRNQATQNVSLSVIQEQIDILNEDYQRQNPDANQLRAIFSSVASNPRIEFRLDSVIYVQTDTLFYGTGLFPDISITNKVKADCTGGDDAWDVRRYLNIWVCNLGDGGVLGFAYPPANLSNWPAGSEAPKLGFEGVVLDYRIVGRSGLYSVQGQNIVTQGRSATHEVGHYLGLRHIWGDGTLAIFGIPDCTVDDGVTDTPNQGMGSNFQCDTTANTCEAGQPNDLPDMIENYMDYSTESCMNTFTQGQADIMRGILSPTGYRYPLTQNTTFDRAPSNDKPAAALALSVNTDNSCTLFANASNNHAHPSYMLDQCAGRNFTAPDVWFSFTATNTTMTLDIPSSTAVAGSSTDVVVEVMNGICPSPAGVTPRRSCQTAFPATLSGLVAGSTYYLRAYSQDSVSRQNFSICLSSNGTIIGVNQLSQLDWNVFPNPSDGQFTIQTPTDLPLGSRLQVSNALGQIIATHIYRDAAPQLQIDLSAQPIGIYTLTISNQNGIFSRKIQVQRP